jgi:hypothetical protein
MGISTTAAATQDFTDQATSSQTSTGSATCLAVPAQRTSDRKAPLADLCSGDGGGARGGGEGGICQQKEGRSVQLDVAVSPAYIHTDEQVDADELFD